VKPADEDRLRQTIVRAVARRPGMAQEELARRVSTALRSSHAAAVAAIRALEREGVLVSSRVERRKVYAVAKGSPLELARRAEIEREATPVPGVPAPPAAPQARRALPAWSYAAAAAAALGWNVLVIRLLVDG
jgi:hypothetical protein